jgi:dipeptidyl aminopeptidase/acylaminoacyl peptidase
VTDEREAIRLRVPAPFELTGHDGGPLRCDLYAPDAAIPGRAILLCHGFRGYKDWGFLPFLATRLADAGFPVVTFSTSASGVTDRAGTFGEKERFRRGTYGGDLEDLRRAADWTADRFGADSARLGIAGHSRGGALALLHATGDPRVAAVAALAAPSRIGVWPDAYFEAWRRGEPVEVYDFRTRGSLLLGPEILADLGRERESGRYDTARAGSRLRAPFLVVHGTRDALVPLEEARALAALAPAATTELRVIEGAGHSFQAGDELRRTPPPLLEMVESVAAWMRRRL